MINFKGIIVIIVFCFTVAGCTSFDNKNNSKIQVSEKIVKESVQTPKNTESIATETPKITENIPTETPKITENIPTETPKITENIPTEIPIETTENISTAENKYKKFMVELNPNIIEMDELFYCEMDVDEDGNKEIIASFGYKAKDISDVDWIESSFVLRDRKGIIELIEKDFCNDSGYGNSYMKVVQFSGSTKYYIVVGVTNSANMNGIAIYKVSENIVEYLDGAQSATGVCYAYLSDIKSDGTYEGFTAEFYSYDVLYYDVSTFYRFNKGVFEAEESKVDVWEYPEKPTDLVVQYLSLKCLEETYFSSDITKRLREIYDGSLDLNIFEDNWYSAIYDYQLEINPPVMTVVESTDGQTSKVIVNFSGVENEKLITIQFDLVFEKDKWRIYETEQTIKIG